MYMYGCKVCSASSVLETLECLQFPSSPGFPERDDHRYLLGVNSPLSAIPPQASGVYHRPLLHESLKSHQARQMIQKHTMCQAGDSLLCYSN